MIKPSLKIRFLAAAAAAAFQVGSGVNIVGACSDGVNFWLGFEIGHRLVRF